MAVIRIPDDLHAAIKERAKSEDRPIVTVLRRAFHLYAAQEADKDK